MTKLIRIASVCLATLASAASLAAADPADPRFVIATDPVGLFQGSYTLAGTYVLAKHVALRASITHADAQTQYTTQHATVSVPIFLDHALHGPFLEPGYVMESDVIGYSTLGVTPGVGMLGGPAPVAEPQSVQLDGPELLVGWQWTYASHLTLSAAGGVMRVTSGPVGGYVPPTTEYQWYLNAGYAF